MPINNGVPVCHIYGNYFSKKKFYIKYNVMLYNLDNDSVKK
jgi:hypothetical protein